MTINVEYKEVSQPLQKITAYCVECSRDAMIITQKNIITSEREKNGFQFAVRQGDATNIVVLSFRDVHAMIAALEKEMARLGVGFDVTRYTAPCY